jgi:hypothetical protein
MNNSLDKNNIYRNVIITLNSGEKEIFDAITITDKGIYTGIIKKKKNQDEEFIDDGLISKENIKKIIVFGEDGNSQNIDFKNLRGGS